MKCPKCNFASFEYINTCKKCGNDLTLHKTELGIDYPQYSALGLMAMLRHEASPQAAVAEPASLVEEEHGTEQFSETSATDKMSGTSGFEAAIGSDTDFTNIGADIDLGGADELDLSGMGESADETASIKLPAAEEEEINLGTEVVAEPVKKDAADNKAATTHDLEGIDFDLGSLEETPAPPEGAKTLDLGEIEEAVTPAGKKEEEFPLDLGDIEVAAEEEKPAATKEAAPPAAAAAPAADFNMEGFDLDINLDEVDLGGAGKKEEPKKDEKKKDDFDIDIDLSDLKLD